MNRHGSAARGCGGGPRRARPWLPGNLMAYLRWPVALRHVACRILPQVVPASFCEAGGAGVVSLPLVADDLRVALVLDEPHRYTYISQATARHWGVAPEALLDLALANLRRCSCDVEWKRIGRPPRTTYLCETFDGYDASRILILDAFRPVLGGVPGEVVLGIPHRDCLVAVSDQDPDLVAELQRTVAADFAQARYPVSPRLFRFRDGRLLLAEVDQ
ncbi:MAG: DUF1444 family protein [Bacillota bacterium]